MRQILFFILPIRFRATFQKKKNTIFPPLPSPLSLPPINCQIQTQQIPYCNATQYAGAACRD